MANSSGPIGGDVGGDPKEAEGQKVTSHITLYTTPFCPRCRMVRKVLDRARATYEVKDMTNPAVLTDLRVKGIFSMAAPILQVGETFYQFGEVLYDSGGLRKEIMQILSQSQGDRRRSPK